MDSSEVVYSRTERSLYMSFMTLVMLSLVSCFTFGIQITWYYGTIWVVPWAIQIP